MPESTSRGGGVLSPRHVYLVPGRGGYLVPGGVLSPGGCVCSGVGGVSGPGGVCSGGVVSQHALRQTPPLWTESQTPVKTLPWPNFVVAGNNLA